MAKERERERDGVRMKYEDDWQVGWWWWIGCYLSAECKIWEYMYYKCIVYNSILKYDPGNIHIVLVRNRKQTTARQ